MMAVSYTHLDVYKRQVYDYMIYISSIKGLKIPFARKKVKQLLNQVGMEKFSKRKMKNWSGGIVRLSLIHI